MAIIWNPVYVDPDTQLDVFELTVSEGQSIVINGTTNSVPDDTDTGETFGSVVVTLISFETPNGLPPVVNNDNTGFVYSNNGVAIPPKEYHWIQLGDVNKQYKTNNINDVPETFSVLTNVVPDPIVQKTFFFVLEGSITGSLGTEIIEQKRYDIIAQNNWDGDKSILNDLMARQTNFDSINSNN